MSTCQEGTEGKRASEAATRTTVVLVAFLWALPSGRSPQLDQARGEGDAKTAVATARSKGRPNHGPNVGLVSMARMRPSDRRKRVANPGHPNLKGGKPDHGRSRPGPRLRRRSADPAGGWLGRERPRGVYSPPKQRTSSSVLKAINPTYVVTLSSRASLYSRHTSTSAPRAVPQGQLTTKLPSSPIASTPLSCSSRV
jgi:hypothetical protein